MNRTKDRPRAVVTGGAGFIGSHLVDRLLAEGHGVMVIDDLSSGTAESVASGATLERLDVASADLDHPLRTWRPGVVYHLAAQSSVVRSIQNPLRDLEVNLLGTHRIATAAKAAGVGRLVFVSSGGAVYGETIRAATERTRPAPASYYGIHKLAGEGHVRLAGLPYAILRPSNIYGPRQAGALEGAVIAAFIDQALRVGTIQIHGDGRQTRDFLHVHDAVEALCVVGRDSVGSGTWNVAAGTSVSIAALAELVEHAVGHPLKRSYGPRRPGDVSSSSISAAALGRLGWRPAVGLADGLVGLVAATRTAPASPRKV